MKCPVCGAENSSDQSYCGACGARLQAHVSPAEPPPTTSTGDSIQLRTGATFAGRYQVIEELGVGGMGRVYKAFDTEVKEPVALKLVKPELASDRETVERFSRELKLARRITHRNVCRLYDLGKSASATYLTMEYVAGEDLRRLMRKVGVFGAGQVVRIARQLCDGLAEAHRLAIVHRDLKPQNVMVDENGNAKIMDFGIARLVEAKGITGAGVVVGTPQYMSPEQVDGEDVDQRSDIYSLGIMLYEMATGRVPFDGEQPIAVAHKQKYDTPADPRTLNAQLPPALGGLILRCLAKDRTARYQTANDVRADLERIAQGLPITEQAVARKHAASTQLTIPLGPRPLLAIAAALVVIAAVLLLWRPWVPKVAVSAKTGKPTIAVTWFDNQSDRADLDRVLVNLLTTNLSRDEALEVVSTQRMFDILTQMGKADAKTIDRSIATEVATRAGAGTMVTGNVVKLGEQVRISAELVNVRDGSIIATLQEDGSRIDDVIPMVDRLTEEIRRRLSPATPAQGLRIADVSTTSLDAYAHYQKGIDFTLRWNYDAACKELEEAVATDPEFGGAWVALSLARWPGNANAPFVDWGPAREAVEQAGKHIGRATERERLEIELAQASAATANYDAQEVLRRATTLVARFPDDRYGAFLEQDVRYSMGDAKGAIAAAQRYLDINPADAATYNALAYYYAGIGENEAAVSAVKKYVALYPDVYNAYDSAWEIDVRAGLYEEALAQADRYRQLLPQSANSGTFRVMTFLMRDDPERARQEIATDRVSIPSVKARRSAYTYLVEGRYDEAEASFRKSLAAAEEEQRKADPATTASLAALGPAHVSLGQMLMLRGRTTEAIREFEAAESVSARAAAGGPDPFVVLFRFLIGTALCRSGDYQGALKKADEIRARANDPRFDRHLVNYADLLVADVAAARKDLKTLGAEIDRLSRGVPRPEQGGGEGCIFWPLEARRFALSGDIPAAIKSYQPFKSNISMSRYGPWRMFIFFHERSRLGYTLGRLYEQQGDSANAGHQYADFLRLMARADPGNAEVEDAKKRLAALDAHR